MFGLMAILSKQGSADPWSTMPRLGVSADFDTNPGLHTADVKSEEHVAALFNVPITYDSDGIECAITPSGRVGNTRGYSSLASNYFHLDALSRFTSDRSSAGLQGQLARDSSLYFIGGLVNGLGVRRDTEAASGDYIYFTSARSQLQLDASWSRVHFNQPPHATILVDYRYVTARPTFGFNLSERDTVKLIGNYGRYQSLSGLSHSNSESVQLAFERQLAEHWTLSASGGYSRAANSQTVRVFIPPFFLVPETIKSNQNGTVYSAGLTHQGERINLSAGITRALQPSGFAYLVRQDSYTLTTTFVQSERWDYQLNAVFQSQQLPTAGGAVSSQRYTYVQWTANWHWTPQWALSLHAVRVSNRYAAVSPSSTGVSVDIIRQFLRTDL
jgi:hypothetical protein